MSATFHSDEYRAGYPPRLSHTVAVTHSGVVHQLHPMRHKDGVPLGLCESTQRANLSIIEFRLLNPDTTRACRVCWIWWKPWKPWSKNGERDAAIVRRALVGVETYDEIADDVGLSRQRVWEIALDGGAPRRNKVKANAASD